MTSGIEQPPPRVRSGRPLGIAGVFHAFREDGLTNAGQEEWLKKVALTLVKKQISMIISVGGQDMVENQIQGLAGLRYLVEPGHLIGLQSGQAGIEPSVESPVRFRFPSFGNVSIGVIQQLLPARIGPPVGEVQVPE